ncbi:HAMP domain-containing protein [Pseudobacteroides cellulosolvens]|uniref:histidine kinase n=1 Tax=Pseudobacteroides cellulosolvens ATCC 35603 = DSM 2933 TaxID=398512 RepID=A0A0L6JVR8_9FIRM|nr:HAMP domain-containing protein [Pseudobacteroides cellulosolvens]KNY29966.1 putative sensor with HAMP domain containing protein [Pseudobacteroides cellulosolvens ATCC 35603 = DSM 2933]
MINIFRDLGIKERIKRVFKIKSLKTKIIILILAATIPIILSSVISLLINDIYLAKYFSMHEKLLTVDKILTNCVKVLPVIREYISDPLLHENRDMYYQLKAEIEKEQKKIEVSSDQKYLYFSSDVSLYLKLCDSSMSMSEKYDSRVRSSYIKIELQMDNVKKSAIDLTMQELNKGNQMRDYISKKMWRLNIGIFVINVVLIIVIILMVYMVLKRVTISLAKLENMSFQVTQGNFDIPFAKVSGDDEISLLSRAFNEMIISIKVAYIEIDNRQVELEKLNMDLIETNYQLKTINEELKNAQEQIIQSEKLASLGGLVAGVSHEINTPIGVSVSAASYLQDKNKELIDKVNTNSLSKKNSSIIPI